MKPVSRFVGLPKSFWASVRTISQHVGYTERAERTKGKKATPGKIKVPSLESMAEAFDDLGLDSRHLLAGEGNPTATAQRLHEYFEYRAKVLNEYVEPRLLNASKAKAAFKKLKKKLSPTCPLPMNKQKGDKKAEAFFTCIINMLIEANTKGYSCDYDPRELTTVTINKTPLRTLARRVDGAFPGPVNPIAVWEIKEYYYTTTFGSRVA